MDVRFVGTDGIGEHAVGDEERRAARVVGDHAQGGAVRRVQRAAADLLDHAADPALEYGCALTSDFKRVCEQVSGLDLDTFFAQWVETGTGYPVYTACSFWQPVIDGWRVRVSLHQVQDGSISNVNVFVMPVEIVVHTVGGDVSYIAQNNQRDQNIDFTVASQPTSVEIDHMQRM